MARDLKLANWTFTTDATGSATTMPLTASTPTGDPTNTQGAFTLRTGALAAANVGVFRGTSDAKNIYGYINPKMDTSSFANFIAGSEISAVSNQPAIWGNSSYMNMYARCAVSVGGQATAATCLWTAATGGSIVLEGAYDNGAATPAPDGLWVPISGPIPLVSGVAALSLTASVTVATSNLFTTTTPHGLSVSDVVIFSAVGGLSGAGVPVAGQAYNVLSVPSPTTFVISNVGSTTALVVTGTSTGAVVQKLLTQNGATKIASVPLTQTLRPWLRWAVYYFSTTNTNTSTVTISKTSLVLGRDNALVG